MGPFKALWKFLEKHPGLFLLLIVLGILTYVGVGDPFLPVVVFGNQFSAAINRINWDPIAELVVSFGVLFLLVRFFTKGRGGGGGSHH